MGKLGKPSLVQWTSTNDIVNNKPTKMFRKTTIMYGVALLIVIGLLFVMGGKKEHMLLNINTTTQLYSIKENNVVRKSYVFLFQNTENKALTFNLQMASHENDFEIKRFKPFVLQPGKSTKKIVILQTDKMIVNDMTKDTPIPIKIRAYAMEEPEKVNIYRDAVFIFPRADKLNK
ncbi:MAG: Uncharacterised protein [Arcobacter lacus]|nr:MAG: Uncharacterised protein [Arcobacter lacus]